MYFTLLNTLCDRCGMAGLALESDACPSPTNASNVCLGPWDCLTLISDFIDECNATDPVSKYFLINRHMASF